MRDRTRSSISRSAFGPAASHRAASTRRPSTSTARPSRVSPSCTASLPRAFSSSRSSSRARITTCPTRSSRFSGSDFMRAMTRASRSSRALTHASAPAPVTASMRRTPAAMPVSDTILKRPTSPERTTWVPPQSSSDTSPMASTRTFESYFSPKKAIAPALERVVERHGLGADLHVVEDPGVDEALDLLPRDRTDGLEVREVEAQPIRSDERPSLLNVAAEHLAKRRVQQVGRRMVARRVPARALFDGRVDLVPDPDPPFRGNPVVDDRARARAGVGHLEAPPRTAQVPPVSDLSPALRIEGGALQDHRAVVLGVERLDGLVVHVQADHPRPVAEPVVSGELARALDLVPPVVHRREAAAGPRPLALGGHLPLEALVVHGEPALASHVGHEVFGKAERVVEAEHDLAGYDASPEEGQLSFEHPHALVEGGREPVLLLAKDPLDHRPPLGELGVRLAHLRLEVRDEAMEERLAHPEPVAVADGAPDDAAQHVSAPLVRGKHPVHDEKGARADVVRDDPERLVALVLGPGQLRGAADEVAEEVDLVVAVHPLQHRGGALEPHAGIDRRLGQPAHVPVGVAVELHEDEVPDLDEAVPVLVGGPGRARPRPPDRGRRTPRSTGRRGRCPPSTRSCPSLRTARCATNRCRCPGARCPPPRRRPRRR